MARIDLKMRVKKAQKKLKGVKAYMPIIKHYFKEVEEDTTMQNRISEAWLHRRYHESAVELIEFIADKHHKESVASTH